MNPPVGFTDPVSLPSEVYKYHRFHPELVEQIVSIYRIMFPHDGVTDEFYEHVVQKLDKAFGKLFRTGREDHANDIAMRNHAYNRGAMVYDAVGATRLLKGKNRMDGQIVAGIGRML